MDQPITNPELLAFQADLKRKLRYIGSFFSIILIVFGLYLLLNGLLALVSGNTNNQQITEDQIFQTLTTTTPGTDVPGISELPAESTNNAKPNISVEGISTVRASASAEMKAEYTAKAIMSSGKWQATDYESGEISSGEYTVKLGDTLWEIAEAVYGSGFQWTQILEANDSSIGFLANGQQALIVPGQVLTIP